jgi:glycosyltransferase involved in cell wall biosynthesis
VPPCHSHIAIEQEFGADLDKIEVIANGIDCNRFVPGPPRDEAPLVVGCFARVVPIKGITVLIRAAETVLKKHQAKFIVIGDIQDEDYYHECQELVEELGLKDHFRFTGHVNSLEWYHHVDIFVLPSLSEGVPYALLEAMSCGLPCVCTAVGGVPEILSDVSVGYVVPPNEPDSLAEKICELLENEPLRKRMGLRATELAGEKYTIEGMVKKFRRLYEGLLNGNSRF